MLGEGLREQVSPIRQYTRDVGWEDGAVVPNYKYFILNVSSEEALEKDVDRIFLLLLTKRAPRRALEAMTLQVFSCEDIVVPQLLGEHINLHNAFNLPNPFPNRRVAGDSGNGFKTSVAFCCGVASLRGTLTPYVFFPYV